MSTSPQLPGAEAPRSRGLLIVIIVLLVAVVGLAAALVVVLSRDDSTAGSPPSGSAVEDSREPAAPEPSVSAGRDELSADESRQIMLEEQHRRPDDPYALGDVDAEIVIVQYADYRCGYCAQWYVTVFDALTPYIESGRVRFEFRDHPVLGEASVRAALAARAAGDQGLFWEYADALYTDTARGADATYDDAYFVDLAKLVGVDDIDQFTADLSDEDALSEIMTLRERALSIGITGTPSFIVDDTLVPGAIDRDRFVALVESKLA